MNSITTKNQVHVKVLILKEFERYNPDLKKQCIHSNVLRGVLTKCIKLLQLPILHTNFDSHCHTDVTVSSSRSQVMQKNKKEKELKSEKRCYRNRVGCTAINVTRGGLA